MKYPPLYGGIFILLHEQMGLERISDISLTVIVYYANCISKKYYVTRSTRFGFDLKVCFYVILPRVANCEGATVRIDYI